MELWLLKILLSMYYLKHSKRGNLQPLTHLFVVFLKIILYKNTNFKVQIETLLCFLCLWTTCYLLHCISKRHAISFWYNNIDSIIQALMNEYSCFSIRKLLGNSCSVLLSLLLLGNICCKLLSLLLTIRTVLPSGDGQSLGCGAEGPLIWGSNRHMSFQFKCLRLLAQHQNRKMLVFL